MPLTPRQKEIVDKSIRLIAERGIRALTIKNIAAELSITEPAIYRHFENKTAILEALLDRFSEESQLVLDTAAESGPLEKVGGFMLDRYRRFAANPALARVIFSEEYFSDDPRLAERMRTMMHTHAEAVQELLRAARRDGTIRDDIEPATLFRLLMGPLRLLVRQWTLSGEAFDLVEAGSELWRDQVKLFRG